jgi:hypothetical protein
MRLLPCSAGERRSTPAHLGQRGQWRPRARRPLQPLRQQGHPTTRLLRWARTQCHQADASRRRLGGGDDTAAASWRHPRAQPSLRLDRPRRFRPSHPPHLARIGAESRRREDASVRQCPPSPLRLMRFRRERAGLLLPPQIGESAKGARPASMSSRWPRGGRHLAVATEAEVVVLVANEPQRVGPDVGGGEREHPQWLDRPRSEVPSDWTAPRRSPVRVRLAPSHNQAKPALTTHVARGRW